MCIHFAFLHLSKSVFAKHLRQRQTIPLHPIHCLEVEHGLCMQKVLDSNLKHYKYDQGRFLSDTLDCCCQLVCPLLSWVDQWFGSAGSTFLWHLNLEIKALLQLIPVVQGQDWPSWMPQKCHEKYQPRDCSLGMFNIWHIIVLQVFLTPLHAIDCLLCNTRNP